MDIKTRIYLDMLTENSVTVKTQRYTVMDGEEVTVGEIHARAYPNSEESRAELAEDVPEPYLSAVFAVWGDESKVKEKTEVK